MQNLACLTAPLEHALSLLLAAAASAGVKQQAQAYEAELVCGLGSLLAQLYATQPYAEQQHIESRMLDVLAGRSGSELPRLFALQLLLDLIAAEKDNSSTRYRRIDGFAHRKRRPLMCVCVCV